MKFGLLLPNFGDHSHPRKLAELANVAEDAGWDGFFIFDHILPSVPGTPVVDPWIAMSAIAMATNRIRLGPMVTPLPRRRPWKLARETASLDSLSDGRLTIGLGLGGPPDREFETFGEESNDKVRAAQLDEGLDVLTGLWKGERFSYEGEHYRLRHALFKPPPVQLPRIPIWIGAKWRHRRPQRRAARWDGVFPIPHDGERITPDILTRVVDYVLEHRDTPKLFDVVLTDHYPEGYSGRRPDSVRDYETAGLTWWLERAGGDRGGSTADIIERVRRGPPAA